MWKFDLTDPEASVTIDEVIYRDGDEFQIPNGWKYDKPFSDFIKRPSFSYETSRMTRNQLTGVREKSIDVKRVSLPVVWIETKKVAEKV